MKNNTTIERANAALAIGILAGSYVYAFKKEMEKRFGKGTTKKAAHPRKQKLAKLGDYYVTEISKTGENENYLELRRRTYDMEECCDTTLALKMTDEQLDIVAKAKHMCINSEPATFTCKGGYIYEWFGTDGNDYTSKKRSDTQSHINADVQVSSTMDFAFISISFFEELDGEKYIKKNFAIKLDYAKDESEFRNIVGRKRLV